MSLRGRREGKGKTGAGLSGVGDDVELGFELRAPSAATAGRQELLLGAVAGCERKESACLESRVFQPQPC